MCHCAVRTDCRAEKLDPVGSERGVRAGEASYASGLGRSRGSGGVVTCKDSLLGCRLGFGLNFSSSRFPLASLPHAVTVAVVVAVMVAAPVVAKHRGRRCPRMHHPKIRHWNGF